MLDLLIRCGTLIDGTGHPRYRADVGIVGDRIEAVGNLTGASAIRTVDANGRIVCPGFIDVHSHSDRTIAGNLRADSTVRQGVTTEVVGNCGMSEAPVTPRNRPDVERQAGLYYPSVSVTWSTFGEYLDQLQALGPSINLVPLVGHNRLRSAVIGPTERPATAEEVVQMERLVQDALDAGAFGLSTGLEFQPGRGADRSELAALSRVVAQRGGVHASHIRNRDRNLEPAVDEILGVAEETGVKLQISHLNAKPGSPDGSWYRVVGRVADARNGGLNVHSDTVPYPGGPGLMAGILPQWLFEGDIDCALERLADPTIRQRLRTECNRYWLMPHLGQWDRVMLGPNVNSQEYLGMTFAEIAERCGKDPWDCFFDVLVGEGRGFVATIMIGRLFEETHVRDLMQHPLFMLASDCWTSTHSGPAADLQNYPAAFGWVPRFIGKYARDEAALSVEEAIRKMTSMVAEKFEIADRGILAAGKYADVVVFDLAGLQERATFADPRQYCAGIGLVVVNGQLTVEGDGHTNAAAGRVLRK